MKNKLITGILLVIMPLWAFAQSPKDVVINFGNLMQSWCNSDDISFRDQIMKLSSGKIACRVDDQISKDAVEKDPQSLLSAGTLMMESYLNIFQDAISTKQKFTMRNIQIQPDFVLPTAFKEDVPPSFVSANLLLNGALEYDINDLYMIQDDKIIKIVDFTSDKSLGKAIELYSNRKYDEAFKIFRNLAYSDFSNMDAQYYTVVMELKKQGCDFLCKKVRDQESAWFINKNTILEDENFTRLAARFPIDDKKIYYAHFPSAYKWVMLCKQPVNSGLMMCLNSKDHTCGFMDESGKIIIPCRYSFVYPFHEGRAMVISKVTHKCGFIDKDGNEVVPMIYEDALCDFYKGRTYCVKDGNAYLVDNMGKVLKIIPGYPRLVAFSPGGQYAMLYVDKDFFHIYDYNGNRCGGSYNHWSLNANGIVTMSIDGEYKATYKVEW